MIKNRTKEISIGITSIIAIFMIAFLLEGESITIDKGITGYVINEEQTKNNVQIAGFEFKVIIDGETYWYMWATENIWYESTDNIEWKQNKKLPKDLWKGLSYLVSYDANIYYDNELVTDITQLARTLR